MISEEILKVQSEYFNLGQKIAFFRNLKGMSQEELAKKIGKTRGSISAYENNIADLTIPILFQIAKALEVSLYDFVHDVDANKEKRASDTSTTYLQEIENEVKLLRQELEATRKELSDKNKIISLYEEKNGNVKSEADDDIDKKIQKQFNEFFEKLVKKLPPS